MTSPSDLDQLVGTWLTVPDVAQMLGVDPGKVRRLLQERKLVGVRRGTPPVLSVPADFLVPGHLANPAAPDVPSEDRPWTVLAALQGTLTVLGDDGFSDEETLAWLFGVEESLGVPPIEALRAGRKTEVRRVAQAML
ncbi:DNA-binding protein [Cellulomonas sp. zg-ZUI222]|uniref:DNA-binding protein n=1 Tax=Cellulomonas wangleii TaxID=2816956 RepID=A0ABX8D4M0_9CELL|nr:MULTISPECIES: Rv2175c family DNA-binding protein [Cellulomonas]MBO0900126.1 DNA-binding protein [Cellulomonas sp. zg-ZUI22]MBO0920959.1 DNA-binding protein [Cellulomonas wangleii]MBO0925559.1 DNA-binding protein [Cellulomonas wangleii]QVI60977.1 DNA-binding protein [Cellulomonas wangleii]